MNDQLNFNALMVWTAFCSQDYSGLERHGREIYNYLIHNPSEITKLENPLLMGKIFQVCLDFKEPNKDRQEVRVENAFICFSQALKSDNSNVRDEAAARLMMLLIRDQRHLKRKVEQSCQNENANPYSLFGMLDDDMPSDMPMATYTRMLFTAYHLYDRIIDKVNVSNVFVNADERSVFENVKSHVLENCNMLCDGHLTLDRMEELGRIVFERICGRQQKDIELGSKQYHISTIMAEGINMGRKSPWTKDEYVSVYEKVGKYAARFSAQLLREEGTKSAAEARAAYNIYKCPAIYLFVHYHYGKFEDLGMSSDETNAYLMMFLPNVKYLASKLKKAFLSGKLFLNDTGNELASKLAEMCEEITFIENNF